MRTYNEFQEIFTAHKVDLLEKHWTSALLCNNNNRYFAHNTEEIIIISPMDLVKIILLGAGGVGKTSIIQFVWNDFNEEYVPTKSKHVYYSSVIYNDRLYEVKISDLPVIPYFPSNSYYEWKDFKFYGLRNATAYILVFDASKLETFQYIRIIRDQIAESRDIRNVPILVIGNKQDLLNYTTNLRSTNNRSYFSGGGSGSGGGGGGGSAGGGSSTSNSAATAPGGVGGTNNINHVDMKEKYKEILSIIKKQWKCNYMDCSAKFNWKIVEVFKEIIKIIDSVHSNKSTVIFSHKESSNNNERNRRSGGSGGERIERNRCVVL